ncbi:MAG: RNase adapter RapZ [Thermoanaerobaculia bacterium]
MRPVWSSSPGSGSGKSTVARCLEDLGYYCIDNLPLPMLREFLQDPLSWVSQRDHLAVVTDMARRASPRRPRAACNETRRAACVRRPSSRGSTMH